MKLTNTANLPAGLVEALRNDPYDHAGSDITASTLNNPPLLEALKRKFKDDLVEDASDRIWSLLGQAAHVIADRGAKRVEGVESETRLFMDVLGWKLSGAFDHLDGKLVDFKVTSAWTIIYGDRLEDWEKQLNVLAHLVSVVRGVEVDGLEVIAILRDWAAREVSRVKNYPTAAVVVVPLKLWPKDKREAYIMERVRLHQTARELAEDGREDMITPCTDKERWAKTDKKGNKTYVRCAGYCACASVCPVLKREKEIAA